jgi:hypothetical protein
MSRSTSVFAVVLLVVGATVALPAIGAAQPAVINAQESTPGDGTSDASNESIAPGARFSGVVGVQQAELDGEVESRAFGQRVAAANSDNAKAQVVADSHQQNEQRLVELEQRLEQLRTARENGSMSHGEYAARTARVHAELNQVQRSANETERVAETLPAETLEANGVDPAAIRTLRENASQLSGQETAELARSIAGPSVDRTPPERAGPPGQGNQTAGDRGAGDGAAGERDRGPSDDEASDTESENGQTAAATPDDGEATLTTEEDTDAADDSTGTA